MQMISGKLEANIIGHLCLTGYFKKFVTRLSEHICKGNTKHDCIECET